jgi:hypothetical protein
VLRVHPCVRVSVCWVWQVRRLFLSLMLPSQTRMSDRMGVGECHTRLACQSPITSQHPKVVVELRPPPVMPRPTGGGRVPVQDVLSAQPVLARDTLEGGKVRVPMCVITSCCRFVARCEAHSILDLTLLLLSQ